MKACPKCQREWQAPCDQTNCIDLFGECISCRRFRLTDDEVKQIEKLMNPNNPKNEREHTAVREIELLQEALHAALQMIELLQEALPKPVLQDIEQVDAVDTLTEQEAAVDTLTEQEAAPLERGGNQ